MTHKSFAAILATLLMGVPLAAGAQEQEPAAVGGTAIAPGAQDGVASEGGAPNVEAVEEIRDGLTARDDWSERGRDARGRMGYGYGMMGHDYRRAHGELDDGLRDHHVRGQGGMMGADPHMRLRMMMILMDTDGDGALSLEEVQAVHARFFRAIDADDDERVTLEEVRAFMRGAGGMPGQAGMQGEGDTQGEGSMQGEGGQAQPQ